MYLLRRILISRLGYRNAFYGGEVLDFTDPASGQPVTTLISQPNGHGKTSLISFILNCFDPARRRFLQTRRVKDHLFEDYVTDKVGVIVLELEQAQGDLLGKSRLLVGQMAIKRQDRLDRAFFTLRPSDTHSLDSLPFQRRDQSEEAQGDTIETFADFQAWRHEMEVACGMDFFCTGNQAEWLARLDQEGVDHEVIGKQSEFAIAEGGVDKILEQINSERKFLEHFFALVLRREESDTINEKLGELMEHYAQYPYKERALHALQAFQEKLEGFGASVSRLEQGRQQISLLQQQLAGVVTATRQRAADWAERIAQLENEKAIHADQINTKRELLAGQKAAWQGVELALATRRLSEAEATLREAESEQETLKTTRRELAAAVKWHSCVTWQTRRDTLQQALELATEDLLPLRSEVADAAAVAREVYDRQIKRIDGDAHAQRQQRDAAKAARWQAQQQGQNGRDALTHARSDLQDIRNKTERADQTREDLIQRGRIPKGLTVDGALTHWQTQHETQTKRAEDLQAQRNDITTQRQALRSEIDALNDRRGEARSRHQALEQQRTACTKAREALKGDPAYRRLTHGEREPEDTHVTDGISAHLHELEAQRFDWRQARDGIEADRLAIEDAGLRAPDRETRRVIEALSAAGVTSIPFYQWLAQTHPDPDDALALIQADAARADGVLVYTPEDLARLDELTGDLELDHPVVVSLPPGTEAATPADRRTLPPANAAAYNKDAAQAYAGELVTRIEAYASKLEDNTQETREYTALKERVAAYIATYTAAGFTEGLRRQTETARQALTEIEQTIETTQARDKSLASKDEELAMAWQQTRDAAEDAKRNHAELTQAQRTVFEPAQAARAREAAVEQSINEAQQAIEAAEAKALETEQLIETANQAIMELQSLVRDAKAQRNTVVEYAEVLPNGANLEQSPEEARTAWESRRRVLLGAEQDKNLSGMRQEIAHTDEQLTEALNRYGVAAQGLEEVRVKAHAGAAGSEELQRRLDELEQTLSAKGETVGVARATRDQMRSTSAALVAKYSAATPYDWPDDADIQMVARHAAHLRGQIQASEEKLAAAIAHSEQLQTKGERLVSDKQNLEMIVNAHAGRVAGIQGVDTVLPADTEAVAQQAGKIQEELVAAEKDAEQRHHAASQQFDRTRRFVDSDSFAQAEPKLSQTWRKASFDQACDKVHQDIESLTARIAAIQDDLNGMKQYIKTASGHLNDFYGQILSTLRGASKDVRIPDQVPTFGGREVLRITLPSIPKDERDTLIQRYLEQLPAKDRKPASGAALAADLLLSVAARSPDLRADQPKILNIRLIKFATNAADDSDRYMHVARMTGSGGEGMTTALVFYLLAVSFRSKARHGSALAGSFLVLDNPLGQANALSLVRSQLQMAQALGVQIIAASGIHDLKAEGEFRRVLRAKIGRRSRGAEPRAYLEYAGLAVEAPEMVAES